MRDDKERLLDIKEAIQKIEKYSKRGMKLFGTDELVQRWVVSHLQIIGEAARHLSDADVVWKVLRRELRPCL